MSPNLVALAAVLTLGVIVLVVLAAGVSVVIGRATDGLDGLRLLGL